MGPFVYSNQFHVHLVVVLKKEREKRQKEEKEVSDGFDMINIILPYSYTKNHQHITTQVFLEVLHLLLLLHFGYRIYKGSKKQRKEETKERRREWKEERILFQMFFSSALDRKQQFHVSRVLVRFHLLNSFLIWNIQSGCWRIYYLHSIKTKLQKPKNKKYKTLLRASLSLSLSGW